MQFPSNLIKINLQAVRQFQTANVTLFIQLIDGSKNFVICQWPKGSEVSDFVYLYLFCKPHKLEPQGDKKMKVFQI